MKKALPLILILAAFNQAIAGIVRVQTAQNVAINFFKVNAKNLNPKATLTASLNYTRMEADSTVDFYIFDMGPVNGFVIVSGDDNILPVIGYSTESNFNASSKRAGVTDWMNHAATHIHNAIQQNVQANNRINGLWTAYKQGQRPAIAKSAGVGPLLSTTWDQEPYYNQYCPYNTTNQEQCLTGCVATAMAQIMKYWNYPPQGTGSYAYNDEPPMYSNYYGIQSANFGATTYQWDSMPSIISSNNTAIATLMRQCGVAVAMDYGDDYEGGSGAYVIQAQTQSWRPTAQSAYVNNFLYNPNTLVGVVEANYTATDWFNLITGEINAGPPVQYLGLDTIVGGHTWVCDGYDANGMLHMNWGWSGVDDGYFAVNNLSAAGMNFSNQEAALIGIEPLVNLVVTATVSDSIICAADSTTLTAIGSASATYSWSPITGLSCPTCAVTTASPPSTTVYTVTVDSAGFTATATVTVYVRPTISADSSLSTGGGTVVSGNRLMPFPGVPVAGSVSVWASELNSLFGNSQYAAPSDSSSAGSTSSIISDTTGCASLSHNSGSNPPPHLLLSSRSNQPSDTVYGSDRANVSNTGNNFEGMQNETEQPLIMTVFPNPANSQVSLQLNRFETLTTLTIRDVLGQVLITQSVNSIQTIMDVSSLASGIYFAELKQGQKTLVQEFVVRH